MNRAALAVLLAALAVACDGGAGASDAGSDADAGGTDADASWPLTVYVVAGASSGGDGSERAPYATVDEAVRASAGSGRRLLLSPGRHVLPEQMALGGLWRFEGAGSALTTVVGPSTLVLGWNFEAEGIGIESLLRLSHEPPEGQVAESRAQLVDIVLRDGGAIAGTGVDAELSGVTGQGGSLSFVDAESLVVRDTELRGGGLSVTSVVEASLVDVAVLGGSNMGIYVGGSGALLRRVRVEDIAEGGPGELGAGVRIVASQVTGEELTVYRSARVGLSIADSTVGVTELEVEGAGTAAVQVQGASELRLRRGLLREAGTLLLVLDGARADIADTDLNDAGVLCGVASGAGSELIAVGGYVADCPDGGFSFLDGGSGGLDGVLVERTTNAGCVAVADSLDVMVARSTLRGCAGSGVGVLRSSGVEVVATEVSDVTTDPVAPDATGSLLAVDSVVSFEGNQLNRGAGAGIRLLRAGGEVMENVVVSPAGEGISIVGTGSSELRVVANDVLGALGIGIFAAEATVGIADNLVDATRLDAAEGIGDGVVFGESAVVDVRGNTVTNSGGNGIAWFAPATGTVVSNIVRGSAGYGLFEYCIGDAAAEVAVADNELETNALGDASSCP